MKRVLAFDFGASSGRAVLCSLSGSHKLEMREVHRFSNDPVNVCGTLYWDVLRLFHEIKQGIVKAKQAGGFDSVGIDTWGVDFGLIGADGKLLANPVHYRDSYTKGMREKIAKLIPDLELYADTGVQFKDFNTLYQLSALKETAPELLARAKTVLLMPDLFGYFLTGELHAEFSNVSTTQLLDQTTGDWNRALLQRAGLFPEKLPDIVDSGTVYGRLTEEIAEELGVPRVPVIAVCSHDTASAVVSVPASEKDFVFLSCGTWSLLGTETDAPIRTDAAFEAGFTNERGYRRSVRFLKNIMGLWIIQECRRQWAREGREYSFAEIAAEAEKAQPFRRFIDVDDDAFSPPGDMPGRILAYLVKTGQTPPLTVGETARCVYESLAMKYRYALDALTRCTGKKYGAIHIVGGGSNASLLCRFTADACGLKTIAGPSEGTAAGNALVQLMSLGEISGLQEAREIVGNSTDLTVYEPEHSGAWDGEYQKFKKVIGG